HAVSDSGLASLFHARAALVPDAIAVADGVRSLNYRELALASNHLARRLCASGLRPGECVAILATRSIEAVVAILGVLEAGACYVPLDNRYPLARLQLMVSQTGSRLVLSRRESVKLAERLGARSVFDMDALFDDDAAVELPAVSGSHAAYVMYTSG